MEIKKEKKKLLTNIIFFLVVIIVLAIVVISINLISKMKKLILNANLWFILFAVLLMLIHVCLTNLSMYIIQNKLRNSVNFFTSITISNTEYLFNAITPFSSGGQPFQAYYYIKNGLSGDEAASILVANFTIYQFVLTLFSTTGLIIYYNRISQAIQEYIYLIIIGYFFNTVILVGLILVSFVKSFKKLLKNTFKLFGKIRFLAKPMEKLQERTFSFVENFQAGVKYLFSRKRVFLGSSFLRLFDLFVVNAIPILIFLALGTKVEFSDYLFIIMMSAFASTFMMWVPTPGASGGVEWAYTVLFVNVIATTSVVVTSMLVWRVITYYLGIILGFISYLIIERRSKIT